MKQCENPLKGLECTHMIETELMVCCELPDCHFKKIDYKYEMEHPKDINGGKQL